MLCRDVPLRKVEAIVVVAVSEVVDVVSDHRVFAVVEGTFSGPLTSTSEVSLQGRGTSVEQRKNISIVRPGVPESLLQRLESKNLKWLAPRLRSKAHLV